MNNQPAQSNEPGTLCLRLDTRGGSENSVWPFAQFHFGGSAAQAENGSGFHLPLKSLGAAWRENWFLGAPVETFTTATVRGVRNRQLMLCELSLPMDGSMYRTTFELYRELLQFVRESPYEHLVRIWNHIPEIARGEGDEEGYKQFCLARGYAFDQYFPAQHPPAGTGVGAEPGKPLHVLALASRAAPRLLENPRQVSAFDYPRQYGPRSPSFSRAVALRGTGSDCLFVSGTASIVGHDSQHEENLAAQIAETLENWEQLFKAYAFGGGRLPGFHDESLYRAYLRHAGDFPAAYSVLESRDFPLHRTVFLQAEICRSELLFELEGVLSLPIT